ncbi:MAG: glycosyltransferase family 2 protein [Anaerolineales bacterium]|nr:glycosyltransferase family 2 protein [Anaerolineales bacterium]
MTDRDDRSLGLAQDKAQPLVYIMLLNWNDAENTLACLCSVYQLDYLNLRVLVVDNGSTDGSDQVVCKTFPQIEFIANGRNLGFAGGANVGLDYARRQGPAYVFFINNDTILDRSLLKELIQVAEAHPRAGLLAPKIYYYDDPTLIWAAGARFAPLPPRVKMIGLGKRDHPRYDVLRRLDYATGCALLIRREVLETVGVFDPIYWPIYHEDYDYCARVAKGGWEIWYVPTARMWHKVSRSQRGSGTMAFNLGKNIVPFYLRHGCPPRLSLALFVAWAVLRELIKGNLSFARPYLAGVGAGLARHRAGATE